MFGEGISRSGNLLDVGVDLDIIEKSGSWFYYGGERLAQGKDNAKKMIEEDEKLIAEIEEKIKAAMADGAQLDANEFEEEDGDDEELDIRLLDLDIDE